MAPQAGGEALRGRSVLVTGSGCGLGSALVRAAAAKDARVVINCRSDTKRAEALAEEIRKGGGQALAVRADVADPEQAGALLAAAQRAFGRVDVLINTVGAFLWKPVADMESGEWRKTLASNLDSVYHLCRLVLPAMREGRFGRIVNFGAVGAERTLGQPEAAAYSAAKAGVIAFSKALALEEARFGITVNVVCPGVFLDGGSRRGASALGERVPVGRLGHPDDVTRAVLFFACPAADFVTGQVLEISGGWQL